MKFNYLISHADNCSQYELQVDSGLMRKHIFNILHQEVFWPEKIINRNKILDQGWITLFGTRATLETNLIYAGQFMYHLNFNFEKKWAFRSPLSKIKYFKRHFQCFINLNNVRETH
jgi:hypothetical protein